MVVTDLKPQDAFAPRADLATVFGPSASVSSGYWVYQHGFIRAKSNLAREGCSQEEIVWLKAKESEWDAPHMPLPLPDSAKYDAASLQPAPP